MSPEDAFLWVKVLIWGGCAALIWVVVIGLIWFFVSWKKTMQKELEKD